MCPRGILYIDDADNVCRITDETRCGRLGGCERKYTAWAIKIN
jgi:hypothetical protein